MSEATATILSGILGAVIGGVFVLAGVWVGYYFSKRASEGDRQTQLQYAIYKQVEAAKTLLMAFKKRMINQEVLHEKWTRATEEILVALIRSGLSKEEKKHVLRAINGRWENPETVSRLQQLADELLEKLDPEFAAASKELLNEFGVKPEDIDPIILTSKSSRK